MRRLPSRRSLLLLGALYLLAFFALRTARVATLNAELASVPLPAERTVLLARSAALADATGSSLATIGSAPPVARAALRLDALRRSRAIVTVSHSLGNDD